jgi:hypothetical protein
MFWAAIGILIQTAVITSQALGKYYWKLSKRESFVDGYEFPLACAGTIMVCSGVLACARAIERCTTEVVWIPAERTIEDKRNFKLMWVQQSRADETVSSCAIFRDDAKDQMPGDFRPIWGSYRTQDPREVGWLNNIVLLGTGLCLLGFPLQLVGLRGLHYSATFAQLVATVLMVLIRTFVRTGLSKDPRTVKLRTGYELDKVALQIAGLESCRPGPRYLYWRDIDG